MEGVVAVVAPFAMVVAIVWLVQNGKNKRAEMTSGSSREDQAIIGQMQHQIDKLTDRVAVLERLVTDDDRRLSREIDSLRDRGRPPA
ncbi:MAG: Phage shock protein [Pseudomonadota bacterium]|jgi:phage shock protein B